MKLLHVIPGYYPTAIEAGGPIESVYLLNKALVKKGISVDVVTAREISYKGSDAPFNQWVNLEDVQVKYFPYYFYIHYTFAPEMFFYLLKQVGQYDLVHVTSLWNFPALAGSFASKISKKPFVLSPRGVLYEETIKMKSNLFKRLYFSSIARNYFYRANAIHFTTEHERDNLASFIAPPSNSFVVPNGIDLEQYTSLPNKETFTNKYPVLRSKKYLLFLGRIARKKGLDILIDAYKEISKSDDAIYLVIAGPDREGYKNEIDILLKKSGILDKVIFTGMLRGNDKFAAFVGAEAFVLPSYSENFGMAVVEAMACGTPVIISNEVGISSELLKNKAGLITKLDPKDLYLAINNLIGDKTVKLQLVDNAKQLVKRKYDINVVADMMINEYKKILENTKQ